MKSFTLKTMKNIMLRHNRGMLLVIAALFSAFLLGGTSLVQAHDGNRNDYRDGNGNYHHYGSYHHHHGYWNQNNSGVRFWINVG
jgi:hypothetical protein